MNPKHREKAVLRVMSTCVHFIGVQHAKCAAGVAMAPLRDTSQPGMAAWPCLTREGREATTVCPKRDLPDRARAEVIEDEREKSVAAFLNKVARGECAGCGVEHDDWKQSGSCIYAPCGHRVGQGDAAKYKAGVLETRAAAAPPPREGE